MFDNLFLVPLQYAPARSRAKAYAFSRSPMLLPITAADRQTAHIQCMKAFFHAPHDVYFCYFSLSALICQ